MSTWETVCDIAGSLPDAEAGERHGCPVWRVNGKVIVQLEPGMRVDGEAEIRRRNGPLLSIATTYDERAALLAQDPDTFFITPHWTGSPAVLVWLERAEKAQLRELLTDAWRARMPKRRLRELEGRADPT